MAKRRHRRAYQQAYRDAHPLDRRLYQQAYRARRKAERLCEQTMYAAALDQAPMEQRPPRLIVQTRGLGDVMPDSRFRFTLEFNSLVEFAVFVAIVRGEDFGDDARLQELTARLKKSTDAEQQAVDAAKEK